MGSPPARNFSMLTSSTLISFASNSSCDVMSSSPVIVSPREKLSLLMFNETDAFGALNDLNSGKNHIPSFLGIIVCGWGKNILLLTNSDCSFEFQLVEFSAKFIREI